MPGAGGGSRPGVGEEHALPVATGYLGSPSGPRLREGQGSFLLHFFILGKDSFIEHAHCPLYHADSCLDVILVKMKLQIKNHKVGTDIFREGIIQFLHYFQIYCTFH